MKIVLKDSLTEITELNNGVITKAGIYIYDATYLGRSSKVYFRVGGRKTLWVETKPYKPVKIHSDFTIGK